MRVLIGLACLGVVVVMVGVSNTGPDAGPDAGPDERRVASARLSPELVLGVHKFGACIDCSDDLGPNGVDAYARWLGGDRVLYAEDNVGDTYWEYFEQGWPDSFRQWQEWKAENAGRRVVLGVPFYVDAEPGTDHERIAACARGAYDAHYVALGTNLVSAGLGDSILRIAWEAHGTWAPWSYRNNIDDWRACWRRVATTLTGVAPDLRMNWNVGDDNGGNRSDMIDSINERGFDNFYPGDDVVDEIGIDSYDIPKIVDYDAHFGDHVGSLGWFARTAREHAKPLSFPEWGLWDSTTLDTVDGSRDDVVYIERMFAWMDDPANGVVWAAYFDVNVDASTAHQLQPNWAEGTVFPRASERFRQLFGAPR